LALDVVLHFGEVVCGNVGTTRRLDFTVIGRAVNEVSRIEKLCDELGLHILISDEFAKLCSQPLKRLGAFTLRGVELPRVLFTPE
jgi:adenylate cyclase